MSDRVVGRLSVYRRLLTELLGRGVANVYSHELADLAGCTAAQVRRDLMAVGSSGTPTRGYAVAGLYERITRYLDSPGGQSVALVGVGNLGRAILAFFSGRRPKLKIVAGFDSDPEKVGRTFSGCRCFSMAEMTSVVREARIDVGIITAPADCAQEVAGALVGAGVKGILNFAPVTIHVAEDVYVEPVDMTVSLERVAFYARRGQDEGSG